MHTVSELSNSIANGSVDELFRELQPPGIDAPGAMERYRQRWLTLLKRFSQYRNENTPAGLFTTPGRTEIGGNHTDHQHGCVLAGSVNLDIIAVAAPNNDGIIRIWSEGFPELEVSLDSLEPNEAEYNDSSALARGIAAQFIQRGFDVPGYDICTSSNVLKGSGLSSSAAFEILLGTVVDNLFAGEKVGPVEVAKIGRYAENHYFGKPCGLMDQLACCLGGVVAIDFNDVDNPSIRQVPFDLSKYGVALCIIDSGADHADLTDAYSPIPGEMKAVAAHFGKDVLREIDPDEFMRTIPAVRKIAGDRAVLRAIHFYVENQRAGQEADAILNGDITTFLALVNESGRSSHMYLQNIFPPEDTRHQDVGLVLALCDRLLQGRGAFRVHGGGFAGTVQAFVPLDMLDVFKTEIEKVFGMGHCHVLSIRAKGSIRLL